MILAGDMTPVISSRKSVAIDMNHMAAILSSFFPDVAGLYAISLLNMPDFINRRASSTVHSRGSPLFSWKYKSPLFCCVKIRRLLFLSNTIFSTICNSNTFILHPCK